MFLMYENCNLKQFMGEIQPFFTLGFQLLNFASHCHHAICPL